MVTLTIHTPSCRSFRNRKSLILRGVLVCAALWLFITVRDVLRKRREMCDGRYRPRVRNIEPRPQFTVNAPRYPETGNTNQKTKMHASDNLLLDNVQHSGADDGRRLATEPGGSTTEVVTKGKSYAEHGKPRRPARERPRTGESHRSDTKRSDRKSSYSRDDGVAWHDLGRGDGMSDDTTGTHQRGDGHPEHERTSRYKTPDKHGAKHANSELDPDGTEYGQSSEPRDGAARQEDEEHTPVVSHKVRQDAEDEEHQASTTAHHKHGTEHPEDDGTQQTVDNFEQQTTDRMHSGSKHPESSKADLQRDHSINDYDKAYGDPRVGDQSQEAGEASISTTSSDALFTIVNDSKENDALYYHHNLPPVMELLHDGQEEKHPLPDHTVRICSQRQRQLHLRETCHDLFDENRERRRYKKRRLKLVAINHRYRLLYCILPKTGSRSWLTFLVNLTSNGKERGSWNIRDAEFMERFGIEYRRNLYLDELDSRYKDYVRFVVVRHPLQRFTSAYYESVVKNGKFRNEDGTLPSFGQFASMFATGRLRPHVQTARYINHCQVCRTKYDYLLKVETIPSDFHLLRSDLGTNVPLPREHVNKVYKARHHTDVFKYDSLLNTLYPDHVDVLRSLMSVYDADNKIFGYGWDFDNQRSTCSAVQGDKPYSCC